MKRLLNVLFMSVAILALFSLHGQVKMPAMTGKNLYQALGIEKAFYDSNREAAEQRAKNKLEALEEKRDAAYKDYETQRDIGSSYNKELFEQYKKKYQELATEYDTAFQQAFLKDRVFNNWANATISDVCQEKRAAVTKELEAKELELKRYPVTQQFQIRQQLDEIKKRRAQLAEGCSLLLNPKSRFEYDQKLTTAPAGFAFEEVKEAVESGMRLAGTGTRVKLNALIGSWLSDLGPLLPSASTKLFNQDLSLSDISVLPKPQGEGIGYYIGFTGTTSFNNFQLKVNVYVIWDSYGQRQLSVSVATPDDYRLTNMFPSLQSLNWMIFPKAKFVLASFDGVDVEGDAFKKGLTFLGQWDLFSGPLAFCKKLEKLNGVVFEPEPVKITGVIPSWNPLYTELNAKVPLYIGVDFTQISKLPRTFTNVINRITLDNLTFEIKPAAAVGAKGVQPTKKEQIHDREKLQELEKKRNEAKTQMDFAYQRYQDQLAVASGKQVKEFRERYEKAKERYEEIEHQIEYGRPRPIVGRIASKSPVAAEAERAKKYLAPISPIKEMPEKQEVSKTTLGAIESARKWGFIVQAAADGTLKLGTQSDPIKLSVSGVVIPPGLKYPEGFVSFEAQLKNMIEFGWLAIGNASIVFDIDVAALNVLLAFGIPFSGVFIKGQVDLGKPGESRASLKAGGGVTVTATETLKALVFDVSGENIRPTDFVRYIGYQLMKSKYARKGAQGISSAGSQLYATLFPKGGGIPSLSLPELIFHKVWGYAALGSASIGGKSYKSGLGLQVEIELFKKKAGMRIFIGDETKGYSLEGFGYSPPLSLTIRGSELIKLYGKQDPAKGPSIGWAFNSSQLLQPSTEQKEEESVSTLTALKEDVRRGALSMDGVLELPMLGLKTAVDLKWRGYTIDGELEWQAAGYRFLGGLKMNTREDVIVINEDAYWKQIAEVKTSLRQVKPQDPNGIAAMLLLQYAEEKPTLLGQELLNKARFYTEKANKKPKAKSWGQRIREAYYEGGVKGFKNLIFTRPEEISREVKKEAFAIANSASLVAKFDSLKKQARVAKIVIEDNPALQAFQQASARQDLDAMQSAVLKFEAALNNAIAATRPDLGLKNWHGFVVSFGMTNLAKLGKQISEQLVPYLNRAKESYTKRIAAIDAKAKRWEEGTIDPTKEKEAIAQRETKIADMKEECRKKPYHKQVGCQANIKFEQTKLLKDKAILKTFVESKASKNVKKVAAIGYRKSRIGKALKVIGEQTLNTITGIVQAIAKGIDILNLTEFKAEYSWNEMKALKSPRLVRLMGEIKIEDYAMPFAVSNMQFDLKNPIRSIKAMAFEIGNALLQGAQAKWASEASEEMQELMQEVIGF